MILVVILVMARRPDILKMGRGWIAVTALVVLSGCDGGCAAPEQLKEHYGHLDLLLEERDVALATFDEKEADLIEWYERQDSIFAILYPDGPRPLISPFQEGIAYNSASMVVDNLNREIARLRDEINAIEAASRCTDQP